MAVYKVPQDVEAEDKLLGPFSFKQFIFLIIMVMGFGLAYALSRVLLPLALIPLPIAIFFGVLALPLRKEQPMEIYIAAVISFMLKPKVRLWKPDGVESLIEVIAPKVDESHLGKNYSQEEVQQRLSYLANIVDSRGWSVRGVDEPDTPMQQDLYNEAQSIDDLLDDNSDRAQQIGDLLDRTHAERKQQIMQQMQQGQVQPSTQTAPTPQVNNEFVSPTYTPMSIVQPETPDEDIKLTVNPYPAMNQSIVTPLSERQHAPQTPTSPAVNNQPMSQPKPQTKPSSNTGEETISPAIIDLAKNHDGLSVATLQREAERINKKEKESVQEVVISLR